MQIDIQINGENPPYNSLVFYLYKMVLLTNYANLTKQTIMNPSIIEKFRIFENLSYFFTSTLKPSMKDLFIVVLLMYDPYVQLK